MRNKVTVDIAKYRTIDKWAPKPGDLVIKHGWITRTKWFGIVTGCQGNFVDIVVDGLPRLVIMSNQAEIDTKTKSFNLAEFMASFVGSYTVISIENGEQIIFI